MKEVKERMLTLWGRTEDFTYEGEDLTGFSQFHRNPSTYVMGFPMYGCTPERLAKIFAPDFVRRLSAALGVPRSTQIKFSDELTNSADTGKMLISLQPLGEESLTTAERFDVLGGFICHEAAHIKYTDFAKMSQFLEERKGEGVNVQALKLLVNFLEDERIEQSLINDTPGIAGYISSMKKYVFANNKAFTKKKDEDVPEVIEILQNILLCIRYPSKVDDAVLTKYPEIFTGLVNILEKSF